MDVQTKKNIDQFNLTLPGNIVLNVNILTLTLICFARIGVKDAPVIRDELIKTGIKKKKLKTFIALGIFIDKKLCNII